MNVADIDILLAQVKNIILNKAVDENTKVKSTELKDLEDAIFYLGHSITEACSFVSNLSIGNLDVEVPNRYNFISSSLKELHSELLHLTWQANQVANGDYSQRVSHLGDFSDSFNKMIFQLQERENKLTDQATALKKSMDLLVTIIDSLSSYVVVIEEKTGLLLYANHIISENANDAVINKYACCNESCALINHINSFINDSNNQKLVFTFDCPNKKRSFHTQTFSIQWNQQQAFVHIISDITNQKKEKEKLETFAFNDELTGLYNRRYGIQLLTKLINNNKSFSICLIDLDGLKKVNDNLGHTAGDDYIIAISNSMSCTMPEQSTLCRVGGDEFMIILPQLNEERANCEMKKLDEHIATIKRNYPLSVSAGVLFVESNVTLSPESIMEQVDEKMYIVKNKKHKMQQ